MGLMVALTVGAAFRLVWPTDMEYKGDEVYTFERTQRVGVDEAWPWGGMSNSADVPHPGMSVWVFVGLARLINAHDPVTLNVACMAVNVAALGLLVLFVACFVPVAEREPWWWAAALVAVNPLAVLFHRKIWPPSVIPALTILLLMTWWRRNRRLGAFGAGLLAAAGAQIHPGTAFFAAGLALWTLIFDRRSFRWRWAAGGGLLGIVPALPWLYQLLFVVDRSAGSKVRWWHPFELRFPKFWLTEPFGFNLQYALGEDFGDFLRYPLVAGQATYLAAVLHGLLALALICVVGRWLVRWRQQPVDNGPTAITIAAVGLGYGLLLTLSGLPVYRHYMIVTFPVMFVWLARTALSGFIPATARKLLAGTVAAQACLTGLFLVYIHTQDRPIRGDYGAPYRVQRQINQVTAEVQPSHAPSS